MHPQHLANSVILYFMWQRSVSKACGVIVQISKRTYEVRWLGDAPWKSWRLLRNRKGRKNLNIPREWHIDILGGRNWENKLKEARNCVEYSRGFMHCFHRLTSRDQIHTCPLTIISSEGIIWLGQEAICSIMSYKGQGRNGDIASTVGCLWYSCNASEWKWN